MAGKKPRILCSQCGSPLKLNVAVCPSCGVELDWQEESKANAGPAPAQKRNAGDRRKGKSGQSSKMIMGVLAAAALCVVAYELFLNKPAAVVPPTPAQPVPSMADTSEAGQEIRAIEARIGSDPNNMPMILRLANLLQDAGSYEKAIGYYRKYLDKNPSDPDARVDEGICFKEMGNLAEAKKQMMEALKNAPRHLNANFNLGIVCLSEGNVEESNKWLKKTVALDPTSEVGKRAQQILTQHNPLSPQPK